MNAPLSQYRTTGVYITYFVTRLFLTMSVNSLKQYFGVDLAIIEIVINIEQIVIGKAEKYL